MLKLTVILIAIVSGLTSWVLTGLIRNYALRRNLLDKPNERSSHTSDMPRGGGLAIAITFLTGLLLLSNFGFIDGAALWAYFGAGSLIAAVGFVDDHRHVSAALRLMVHFAAALWILYCLFPDLHFLMLAVSSVALVWLLNLYNFMDGIDGIAGIEAVTVSLGGIILANVANLPSENWISAVLLAGATVGFLLWNFPSAKIFMGDAGSGFIGIIIGAFVVHAATVSLEYFSAWLIILGCFVVDATLTLLRRILRRQRIYEAHRSHAYQFAARRYGSHIAVTMVVAAINLFWLLPIAAIVVAGYVTPLIAVTIAWIPLASIALYFGAGSAER